MTTEEAEVSGQVATRRRPGSAPRGRGVTTAAREAVAAALAGAAPRGDLLIEHLHALQDRFGGLRESHLLALAESLRLAPVAVFEVDQHTGRLLPSVVLDQPSASRNLYDSDPNFAADRGKVISARDIARWQRALEQTRPVDPGQPALRQATWPAD